MLTATINFYIEYCAAHGFPLQSSSATSSVSPGSLTSPVPSTSLTTSTPSTSPTSSSLPATPSTGMPRGTVVGIALGSFGTILSLLSLIATLFIICQRRRRRKRKRQLQLSRCSGKQPQTPQYSQLPSAPHPTSPRIPATARPEPPDQITPLSSPDHRSQRVLRSPIDLPPLSTLTTNTAAAGALPARDDSRDSGVGYGVGLRHSSASRRTSRYHRSLHEIDGRSVRDHDLDPGGGANQTPLEREEEGIGEIPEPEETETTATPSPDYVRITRGF